MTSTDAQEVSLVGKLAGMRTFRIQMAVLVIIYTVVVYGALYLQSQRLLNDSLQNQAASYFDLVKHTRAWNSGYGGVWVEKGPGVETNQFLYDLGVDADIVTEDGTVLTLRNPSPMTSEISMITHKESGVAFNLVSTDALNPANEPDIWEAEALDQLEDPDVSFVETVDRTGEPAIYRYMEALIVNESCLGCHGEENYDLGDVRGGVSVNIPMDYVDEQLNQTAQILGILTLLTLGVAIGASQFLVTRLQSRLDEANFRLSKMAITDELTGLANRRATMSRLSEEFSRSKRTDHPLSVISIDVDHFKRINDRYGHAVGDAVLIEIANRMSATVRKYDLLGRIGGEEFAIISPETDQDDARHLAERILESMRDSTISVHDRGLELSLTVSAGVATISGDDERADVLVARSDDALYCAKNEGRDRVCTEDELT